MLICIGFGNATVQEITGDQGINSVKELRCLDEDGVANLCMVEHRPGGTDAEGPADPGIKISVRAEENLNLVVNFIKHQDRLSHAVSVSDIDLTTICKFSKQHDVEMSHTDPDVPQSLTLKIDQSILRLWRSMLSSFMIYLVFY